MPITTRSLVFSWNVLVGAVRTRVRVQEIQDLVVETGLEREATAARSDQEPQTSPVVDPVEVVLGGGFILTGLSKDEQPLIDAEAEFTSRRGEQVETESASGLAGVPDGLLPVQIKTPAEEPLKVVVQLSIRHARGRVESPVDHLAVPDIQPSGGLDERAALGLLALTT